jgi:RNA polymerase sigma factor (sigma-70 family)
MSPKELYLENLRAIERIAAFVGRRNHLTHDELMEFVQEVRVRLLDDDYAVIRKFEGRSSFTTYLTTVITRLFHQYRIEQWGKWRPSAEAKRLGDKAIVLERLVSRDGFTFSEAVQVLTTPGSSTYSAAELESIYLRLPQRGPRPVLVSGEVSPDAASVDADAEDRAATSDRARCAQKAMQALDCFIATMPAEDRLILQLRFWEAQKVPDIARRLHLDQKKVYKRLDRLFGAMRTALARAGVDKAQVQMLLSGGDQDILLDASASPGEIRPFRLSHGKGTLDAARPD